MKLLPAALLCVALAATALAQRNPRATGGPMDNVLVGRDPGYFLAPRTLDIAALLPPPPASDSPATKVELDQIFALQQSRTPEQAARCAQIETEDIWLFGSEVLGPWFTAANLPKTAAFFAQVREDFIVVNREAKDLYPRKRPPFLDNRIKPCIEYKDTPSYPSGHGIQSSFWAVLLGQIFPEQADAFILRAATTRNYKAISGVHYPSDLAAGQAVGEALGQALLKVPAVQQGIAELRTEAAPFAAKITAAASSPAPVTQRPHLTTANLRRAPNATPIQHLGLVGVDARWAEHGPYLQALIERVQEKWYAALEKSHVAPPHGSSVAVTFRIDRTGEAEIMKAVDSGSGKPGIIACQNAITDTAPFPKWSEPMVATLGQSQELTLKFYYQ